MSKPSGMKLVVPSIDKHRQSVPQYDAYDNQFLDNEQEMVSKVENEPYDMQDYKKIAQSQYLPINTSPKHLKQNAKDNEVKRLKNLNNGMQRLSISILQMKQKYKDLDMQQILFKKRNEKKQNEIKQFLSAKKVQKIKRIKDKKRRMQRQAKSLQESINLQQQGIKNKKIEAVKQNLSKLKQLKQKKQEDNKKQAEKDRIISEMYEKIQKEEKAKPKFHIRKMEEDKKLEEKKREEERKFLAKRKENFKPLQFQEFQVHSKRYEDLLQQLETVKKSQRQQEYLKILENNKKLQEIYRGRTYDFVVEQIEERKLKKDEPTQKFKKMKNYQDYVRQNFIPSAKQKSPENSLQGREKHSSMSHRQVKRYRYLQGVSYGEVVQNKPLAKTQQEQRKMGNQYMAFMRSLPKKRDENNFIQQNSEQIERQMKLKQKKPNPLAERSGRKSVDIKLSDKPTRDELGMLMKQLRNKDKEIEMKEKVIRNSAGNGSPNASHKIVGDDLVFNIERKLNLLSKL